MVSQTNEQALEAAIEKQLTGTCLEELNTVADGKVPFSSHHGYTLGYPQDFNARYALDNKQFWAFLEATQKDELEKLQKTGADWQRKVLERYDRLVKKYGLLYLLKKGLSVDNAHLIQNWIRIVEHFDTLLTTDHSIEQLKQTVLQLAVMGRLVPQDDSDEPASVLLDKIAAEKARLVKEKKIKKQRPLPAIADEEKLFPLPKGWEWCRVEDISLHSEAGWSPKCEDTPSEDGKWGGVKGQCCDMG